MTDQEILSRVDHTLIRPTATWPEIRNTCEEAIAFRTAAVCIPPCYIQRAHTVYPDLHICTVVGFPLGYATTAVKLAEAKEAIADGASEIDMVVNSSDIKNDDFALVTSQIAVLRRATQGKILKVIVETCYLSDAEKIELCRCVTQAGADFIATSTGYGAGGATAQDVRLLLRHVGDGVRVKASGGIRGREEMVQFLAAGCGRIGASSAIALLRDGTDGGYC